MQKCTFTDQMGRLISLENPPKRIISLVPSQSELLFDLGLDEEIIGITKFCIHPRDKFKEKIKVGGTKKLNLELIRSLNPDLIIGNKEENEQEQIEELMRDFNVWMSDISDLETAFAMIEQIGELTAKAEKAKEIAADIQKSFANLDIESIPKKKVAYFIWKDPYMLAGKSTFIDNILSKAGLQNVTSENRYPITSLDDLKLLNPDLIFLSSEPYPFKDEHVLEMRNFFHAAQVFIVDGELFSWYGSRLRLTSDYLSQLLNKINCHS